VTSAEGSGDESFGGGSTITFCVRIAQGGDYVIDARASRGPDDRTSNSFFLTVDGTPTPGALWNLRDTPDFEPQLIRVRRADFVVNLDPGDHTFVFHLREDGSNLDQISVRPR